MSSKTAASARALFLCTAMFSGMVMPLHAQTATDTAKQLPATRSELQLSFAPLVKQTAGAVVNVYAAHEVQTRSPFAAIHSLNNSSAAGNSTHRRAYNPRSVQA